MAHIVNLMSIAGIDGTISEEEKNVIVNIAQNFGLTEADYDTCIEAWQQTDESKLETIVPEDDDDKYEFLKNMVLVMMVDGEIDDNERAYIAGLAEQFGVDGDEAVDELIKIVYNEYFSENEESDDEETEEDEVFEGIDDDSQISYGKSSLQFKELDDAFDELFLSACRNAEAYEYFQIIPNTDTRLFRLNEEQLEKVQMMADKGYATAQYVLGRYYQVVQPDDDSIEKAGELLKAAAKGEVEDALAALAVMHLYGQFGDVNLDFYRQKIDEAVNNGSALAMKIKLHEMTEGLNGEKSNPKKVIDFLENNILNDENLAEKHPDFYVTLGDAYRKMGKKDKALEMYEQAKELGFFEADYNNFATQMEGMAQMQKHMFEMVVDFGCDDNIPGCFLLKAEINEGEYEECDNDDEKAKISQTIKESLEKAFELGAFDAAFKLGCNYYYGNYGFEENNSEAWNWFLTGAKKDNGASYAGLATMTKDGICPEGLPEDFADTCLLNAKYRGFITDSEGSDSSQMQCLAIVKADGDAIIYKFNKDDFAKLAGFIGAKRLAPVRVDALDNIAKKAGITDHLQVWIDYEAPRKKLPMNAAAKSFFKGMIAGDIIITLGDKNYDPMMFYGTEELETILKAMKVKNIEVVTDDLDLDKAKLPKDNLNFNPKPTGFVARIQPDGTAHIVDSSVGVFAMFETDIYDPMRLESLYKIGEKLGLKGRLTIWTDNSSLRKQMIMNDKFEMHPIGKNIYPGPVADNFFVAMEDENYNIMLFDDAEQLKEVVVALGVKPENVVKD